MLLEEDTGGRTDIFMPPILMHFQLAADRFQNGSAIFAVVVSAFLVAWNTLPFRNSLNFGRIPPTQ
jgi:hypothetical protein